MNEELQRVKDALSKRLWFPPSEATAKALDGDDSGEVLRIINAIETPFMTSNLPPRHMRKIENTNRAWSQTLDLIMQQIGKGIVMGLLGNRGTGKTQLAAHSIRRLLERDPEQTCGAAKYYRWSELTRMVRETFGKDGASQSEVIADLCKPKLLVIDEVHEGRGSEFELGLMTEVIDDRYGKMLDTVLISNQEESQFVTLIGSSISSRMQEGGGIITMNWDSFRG